MLAELAALGDDLVDVGRRLSARLARFAWLRDALPRRPDAGDQRRAGLGRPGPRADSCHTVWMELHEDLLATLGIARGAEPDPAPSVEAALRS